MCYNCGCGVADDDMGDPNNLTAEDFKKAAAASNQSIEEAKRETLKLLKKELGEK